MIQNNKLLLHIPQNPITADIYLTNQCNNNCSYCRYGHNPDYMSYSAFAKYIEKLCKLGVKGIVLTGGGEPTLNPDFNKITQYLESNHIDYGINTNFCNYVNIHPNYLKVSLDGWDAASYQQKRGIDYYDQVIANIINYSKIRNNTKLGIQCVVTNINDITNFYEAHKYLDIDYISFRPIESQQGEYYYNNSIDIPQIQNILNDLNSKDSRVCASFKWNELSTKFDQCFGNWSQYALDCNGNVLVCCHRPNDIIGHIMDPNIEQLKKNYIIDTTKCDVPCRLTGVNNLLKDINYNCTDINFL